MPNNKIVLNGEVLIDLTEDTATEADVAKGKTFHRADGLKTEGTLEPSSGGGGGSSAKGVNFYDYDGTLLRSYSVEEAQELTELPELPSHDGLACQGWNYTLDGIKAQGDMVDVGAMYITDDGKTRLYISIVSDGRMTVPICFGQTVANGVTVDWGDGSTETFDGTGTVYPTHEYSAVGDYVISLAPQDGCTLTLGGGASSKPIVGGTSGTYLQAYTSMLKKAEIGNNVSIGNNAFDKCYSLASVTIPDSVTSIGNGAFNDCYSLASVTIPDSGTSIGSSAFYNCYNLTSVVISDGVTSIGSTAFAYCYSLASVTLPASLKTIGGNAFAYCNSLVSVTILGSVKSIGSSAFYNCYNLTSVVISDGVTSIGYGAFKACNSLASVTLPASLKTIESDAFNECNSLASVTIPDSVTSIGPYAFQSCRCLQSIAFLCESCTVLKNAFASCLSLASISTPENAVFKLNNNSFYNCTSMTSIPYSFLGYGLADNYFKNCSSMVYLDFSKYTSVPTLSNSSYITDINSDCKIRVPAALYDEWIVATNWSAVADRIVAV